MPNHRIIVVAAPLALAALALAALALAACPIGVQPDAGPDDDDAGPTGTGYPPPRTDLTGALGAADTLDVATWNLKNFPCGNESYSTSCRPDQAGSIELVTDLIASMALDVVTLEEIADQAAFEEIVQRLPDHEGVLSTDSYSDGSYQKIGVIYDATVLTMGATSQLFGSSANFPRPALQVELSWIGPGDPLTFLVIGLHLKAGESNDDRTRRMLAIAQLEAYVSSLVDGDGHDNVIILGDLNETLDSEGSAVFEPLRDGARYTIHTQANYSAGEATYISSGAVIDHLVTTASLAPAIGGERTRIPRLQFDIEDYRGRVSDHLPVVLSIANP